MRRPLEQTNIDPITSTPNIGWEGSSLGAPATVAATLSTYLHRSSSLLPGLRCPPPAVPSCGPSDWAPPSSPPPRPPPTASSSPRPAAPSSASIPPPASSSGRRRPSPGGSSLPWSLRLGRFCLEGRYGVCVCTYDNRYVSNNDVGK